MILVLSGELQQNPEKKLSSQSVMY